MTENITFFILKGDNEKILLEDDDEENAKNKFEEIKQANRKRTGAFELLTAFMLPDGKLDIFNRNTIEVYCPEVEAFIKKLG